MMCPKPHEYDPEERRLETWRGGNSLSHGPDSASFRRGRRFTLLDILLLCLMLGLLIPWAREKSDAMELGFYRVRLKSYDNNDTTTFVLSIHLPKDAPITADAAVAQGARVGWRLWDSSHSLIHEAYDLPPALGEHRELIVTLKKHRAHSGILMAGSDQMSVEFPSSQKQN